MAKLNVDVAVDVKGQEKLSGLGSSLKTGAVNIAKFGAAATVGLAGAAIGLTGLAAEAEKSDAKLANTFKHMKAGAFTTIPALNAQADALGQLSSFDDEGIKEAQATLLTFGNVTGDAFDKGLQSAVDMSDFLGTDLQSSVIQIGKALNDPVKGLTALSRVGVSFTEEQQNQIKAMTEAGDAAGAQSIILGELEKQFGGAAEALANTSSGQAAQALEDLSNAGEDLGSIFLPLLAGLAQGVSAFAHFVQDNMGTIKPIIEGIGQVFSNVFGFIANEIIPRIGEVFASFSGSGNAFAGIFQTIGQVVDFVAKNVFPFLAAMLEKVVAFIRENGPAIGSILSQAFGAVVAVLKVVVPILMRVAEVVFPIVLTAAGILLKGLDGVFKLIGGIFEVTGNIVTTMVETIGKAWKVLTDITTAVWDGITGIIKGAINAVIDVINGFFGFLNGLSFGAGPWDVGPIHVDAIAIDPFNIPLIPHLAQGGIISRPTLALLGESGPEAVVPLNGRNGAPEFHSHIQILGEPAFVKSEEDLIRAQQRIAFLAGF